MTGPVETEFEGLSIPRRSPGRRRRRARRDGAMARRNLPLEGRSKFAEHFGSGSDLRHARCGGTQTALPKCQRVSTSAQGGGWPRSTPGRDRRPHLRLPAERARIRGDARRAPRRPGSTTPSSSTPAPSPPRPCARRGRRSAGRAASNPDAAHRRLRLRRADRPGEPSPPCPRSTSSSATPRSCAPRATAPSAVGETARVRVNDIMSVTRDRRPSDRRAWTAAPAPSSRCRTAATTAAPSASSPTAAATRARCRWARWSTRSGGSSRTAIARWC